MTSEEIRKTILKKCKNMPTRNVAELYDAACKDRASPFEFKRKSCALLVEVLGQELRSREIEEEV